MGFRADATRDILEAVRNEGRDAAKGQADLTQQIERGNAASQIAIERTSAAVNLNVEKTAAAAAAAVLEAAKNAAAINLNVEKIAAAASLEAQKVASAAAMAAAECCCEIKELIRAEHDETRALVNTIESNRVRDALTDAKSEILALRLGAGGTGK